MFNEPILTCVDRDGTRPVVFLIEREDLPDTPEEEAWLQEAERTEYYLNGSSEAYTG